MCPANPVAAHRQPRMQGTRHRQPFVGAGLCSALISAKYGKREGQSPSPTTKTVTRPTKRPPFGHKKGDASGVSFFNITQSLSSFSTAINASVGTCTVPRFRIFFFPSFCFSSSFFLRVMSPP